MWLWVNNQQSPAWEVLLLRCIPFNHPEVGHTQLYRTTFKHPTTGLLKSGPIWESAHFWPCCCSSPPSPGQVWLQLVTLLYPLYLSFDEYDWIRSLNSIYNEKRHSRVICQYDLQHEPNVWSFQIHQFWLSEQIINHQILKTLTIVVQILSAPMENPVSRL